MSKGSAMAGIAGQLAVMVGRLSLVVPAALYHRHRAVMAFDRELRRCGVPTETRRALRRRYQDMIPFNPLRYRSGALPPGGWKTGTSSKRNRRRPMRRRPVRSAAIWKEISDTIRQHQPWTKRGGARKAMGMGMP